MDHFSDLSTELTLKCGLSRFGLNPAEWEIEFPRSKNPRESMISHLRIRNRTDKSFVLRGIAKIKKFGSQLQSSWLQISVVE